MTVAWLAEPEIFIQDQGQREVETTIPHWQNEVFNLPH
jgi:hypothetical protein